MMGELFILKKLAKILNIVYSLFYVKFNQTTLKGGENLGNS